MNERRRTPEGELIWIAHTLKNGWHLKPHTKEYNDYVYRLKWFDLGSRSIGDALVQEDRTKVIDVIANDISGGYK